MPTLEFQTILAAPMEKVWAFFQDIEHSLPALSPPEDQITLEQVDLPVRVGSTIIIRARGPLGAVRWVAKIIEHTPPHAVVFGEEARFVDEQQSGPFKFWQHAHELERIDEKSTRVVDRVTYRVPFGPIGWIADWLLVRRKIRRMFRHRTVAMKKLLEN
ncbi:MAG TPA: SRPBCC family protein [Tepidisphaeraceae bacterium]|jgi:ligand-binding SRPBCC domain-containing protein|nr:SRPBCC family protein [Tepidisphaeraceae bacterium]